jgi:hypothetical protein
MNIDYVVELMPGFAIELKTPKGKALFEAIQKNDFKTIYDILHDNEDNKEVTELFLQIQATMLIKGTKTYSMSPRNLIYPQILKELDVKGLRKYYKENEKAYDKSE